MQIGVNLANGAPWASPETIVPLARRADELGYDSVWVSDHVVIPRQIASIYPYGAASAINADTRENWYEAFAVLAFVAGCTRRVRLGVSVLVVPQRQPLLVAKQWATLDALSGGRTILGVGAGWMREEFEALGMDTFDRRGPATDEAIRLYRAVWTNQGDVSFEGDVYRFAPLRCVPRPAQAGGPPIWVGGHARRSIRRAAELGDGWHVVRMGLDELRAGVATLHELLGRYGRQPKDVAVSVAVAAYAPGGGPSGEPVDADLAGDPEQIAAKVRAYQAAGADNLVLATTGHGSPSQLTETIDFFAREVRPLLES